MSDKNKQIDMEYIEEYACELQEEHEKSEPVRAYLDEHIDELVEYVNANAVTEMPRMAEELIGTILLYAEDACDYELYDDGCPWDSSGDVRETGEIDQGSTTVGDFLGMYSGNWKPTYVSHYGKSFQTYEDEIWDDDVIVNQGYNALLRLVKAFVRDRLDNDVPDEVVRTAMSDSYGIDDKYNDGSLDEMFCYGITIEQAGIDVDMTISALKTMPLPTIEQCVVRRIVET